MSTDREEVATPANWKPGDKVIVPPPKTHQGATHRLDHVHEVAECTDWYLCMKEL